MSDLAEPVVNSDAETKLYVDIRALLPTIQYTSPSATTNIGGYAWADFISIPSGISEAQFVALPLWFYACYILYSPSTVLGILPPSAKGYLTCSAYQNELSGVYNKRYTWCSNAFYTLVVHVASITESTWNV